MNSPPASPKVVFFDAAQTLLQVKWEEGRLISAACESLGLDLPIGAVDRYRAMHKERRSEYVQLNLQTENLHPFWDNVLVDWRHEVGIPDSEHARLNSVCEELIYGTDSPFFRPFSDVVPCLERLQTDGFRLAVVSNWDASLGRILRVHGLADYFELVVASLRVGVEKPDPEIFHLAMNSLAVTSDECFHIGDHPVDDFEGATNAGIRCRIIDRAAPMPGYLTSLDQLPEAFTWTD